MDFHEGSLIAGRYELVRLIGHGGQGEVWVARHRDLDREVALKLLSRPGGARAETAARFQREARALARLNNPYVVGVHDTGIDAESGAQFIAMELLLGEDLGDHLQRAAKPLSVAEAFAIFAPVLEGLGKAHAAGIVHRDLKPSNVHLSRREDGTLAVKLLDFGIARLSEEAEDTALTGAGAVLGTPMYMSPEQARAGTADARSDLWAVGVMLFEALTGRHPYAEGETRFGGIVIALQAAPLRLASELVPELGAEADTFFARAVARDPDARFQTAREMREALATLAGEANAASTPHDEAAGEPPPPPKVPESSTVFALSTLAGEPAPAHGLESIPRPPFWPKIPPRSSQQQEALRATLVGSAPAGWESFGALVPRGLAEQAPAIQRFLAALFGGFERVADRVVRLGEPRFADGAHHQFFAVMMADGERADRRLLTRTFVGYAGSLEQHLARLDPAARKVVLAIVDSNELGAGVRQQIFELNKKFRAWVLPVHIGQIHAAMEDDAALGLLREGLSDFHTFPDVFAVGARSFDATSFFGFRALVNDLVRHLDGTPLLSIWGPPGCGKTSLVEIARGELTRCRFHRVRCVEVPERTIAATVAEIERALGAEAKPDASVRERVEAAARAAKERAAGTRQRAVLVLEDADPCLAPLTDASAPEAERAAARALWMALGKQCAEGVIAVVVTSLSGFVLGDAKLLDWTSPLANQVVKVEVPPLAFGDVRRMLVDLGLSINVTFEDDAIRRVYEASAGNVSAARRLCQYIVKPRRRGAASSPLELIVVRAADVDAAAADLAAMGDTFQSTVLPWLDAAERQVLEIVAARRPRRVTAIQAALEGQCSADAVAAALERLRRMGFVERREGRERVAIPLLEAWVKNNLAPAPGEAERRRGQRLRYLTAGAAATLLLLGGYWMWSLPKEAAWDAGGCHYELDYPSRAASGAEVKLHAFRSCAAAPDATTVTLVARPGTFAHLGKDGEPTFTLRGAGGPDWRQLEIAATFDDVGKARFELDVEVGGKQAAALVVRRDWIAALPGLAKMLIAVAGAIPAALGAVLAFQREVGELLKRLLGRGTPAPVSPQG